MELRENDPATWPVVISIHGIRTTGRWQKELNDVLIGARFRHVPLDFGFFSALSLLMPWSRSSKVEWFHRTYSEKFASDERKPFIIAHSFGSYIVTRAMLKYDDICFERMILCGSIVSKSYPWSAVLLGRDQVNTVLNEAGGRDMWATVVEWVVPDAGSSGVSGFEDTADGRLVELFHERHEHSDYFYRQNYERRWLPFLQGRPVQAVVPAGNSGVNGKFILTACLLIAIAVATSWRFGRSVSDFSAFGESATAQTQAASPSYSPPLEPPPTLRKEGAPTLITDDVKAEERERLNLLLARLRGEWVQVGNLPQNIQVGNSGRCFMDDRDARTILTFDRIDDEEGTVSATWNQHTVAIHRFMLNPGPVPYYDVRRERKDCLGKSGDDSVKRVLEETGRFSVSPGGGRDDKFNVRLTIDDCTLDNKDCLPSMFGSRDVELLETISESKLRLGGMLFIKQDEAQ